MPGQLRPQASQEGLVRNTLRANGPPGRARRQLLETASAWPAEPDPGVTSRRSRSTARRAFQAGKTRLPRRNKNLPCWKTRSSSLDTNRLQAGSPNPPVTDDGPRARICTTPGCREPQSWIWMVSNKARPCQQRQSIMVQRDPSRARPLGLDAVSGFVVPDADEDRQASDAPRPATEVLRP